MEQAVTNVNTRIADKIIGMNVLEQVKIDRLLVQADGTENKSFKVIVTSNVGFALESKISIACTSKISYSFMKLFLPIQITLIASISIFMIFIHMFFALHTKNIPYAISCYGIFLS